MIAAEEDAKANGRALSIEDADKALRTTKAKEEPAIGDESAVRKPIMGRMYHQRATGDFVRAVKWEGDVVQVQPLDFDFDPQGDPITVQFGELDGPLTIVKRHDGEDEETDDEDADAEETDHDADEADHGLKATLATIKELAANGPWEILTAIIGVLGLKWADVVAWAQQQAKLGGEGDESIEATPSCPLVLPICCPLPLWHENRPWNMGSHKRQLIELCGGVGQAAGYLIQDWPEAREWLEKALQTEIAADYRISGVAVDKDNNLIDAREAALKSLVFHCGGIQPAAGFVFDHLGEKKNINPAKAKKKPAKPRPVAKKEKQEKPLPPGQAKADRAKVGGYFRMRETGEDWRIVHVKAIWRRPSGEFYRVEDANGEFWLIKEGEAEWEQSNLAVWETNKRRGKKAKAADEQQSTIRTPWPWEEKKAE